MKTSTSVLTSFGLGIVASLAVGKAMYGGPLLSLGGNDAQAKQAVLASLNTSPPVMHRAVGDSVVADAAAKVDPAVVEIHTIGKAVQQAPNPFGNDPMFQQWFGGGRPRQGDDQAMRPRAAGSGVIISPDGYIITNNHVVANTDKVTVNIGDKSYTAKVIGADPVSDIAVVKIDPGTTVLHPAILGNSNDLRIGDWAIAVGNPLDIGESVTLGIISAINRTGLAAESHPMQSVIQTDAAINPGNSGGALADINGDVIGINEAIYSPTGSYVGIGFAIPINAARKVAAELIKTGRIIRPYIGVEYSPLKLYPAEARAQMGVTTTSDNGVVVNQVVPNSPADLAGLQTYDVILQVNKQPITDTNTLDGMIQKSKVGDDLLLLVERNGHDIIKSLKLKERPATLDTPQPDAQSQQPQMNMEP